MVACALFIAFALATLAAWAAAWHRSDVLQTLLPVDRTDVLETLLPADRLPSDSGKLVRADMWFGDTMGVRNALLVAVAGWGIVWLYRMRELAEVVWPQGQRRHLAWLVVGWWLPVGNLFIPKMIVNDLWAATEPGHRRGNLLLRLWWVACVMTFANPGTGFRHLPHATHVPQAMDQMYNAEQGDGFFLAAALLSLAVVRKLSGRLEPLACRRHTTYVQQPEPTTTMPSPSLERLVSSRNNRHSGLPHGRSRPGRRSAMSK